MTKFRIPFVACLLASSLAAQQPSGGINDQRIVDLVGMGVSQQEIIRMISVADKFDFDLRPVSTDAMLNAGVSEEVIKAMAAKQMSGSRQTVDARGVVVAPHAALSAQPASVPTPPPTTPTLARKLNDAPIPSVFDVSVRAVSQPGMECFFRGLRRA